MKAKLLAIGVVCVLVESAAARAAVSQRANPYGKPPAGSVALRRAIAGQESVTLDRAALLALRQAGREPFRILGFPTAPGARADIALRRFEVAAPGARMRMTGPDGDTLRPLPEVAHFEGTIPSDPGSRVYVAALPDAVISWVRSAAGTTTYVGPDEARAGYVVRDSASASPTRARLEATPWQCFAEQLPEAPAFSAAKSTGKPDSPELTGFQSAGLILETDQELLAKFGGDADAMTAYLLTLSAQFNIIYERDLGLHLTVTEVHVWTTTDPWDGPGPNDQLFQIGDWYHANRPIASYPRSTAFLFSGRDVVGGVAWRPAFCLADFETNPPGHWGGSYGISQIFGDWPAQDWDLFVMLHEIGHNAGSAHTHCYVPPIDMCFSGENGCYVGPTEVPPGGGTIMSYCHLLPPGESNTNLVFHPRCITEQLLPTIQAAACTNAEVTFPDVPLTNPFFHYVQTIYELGITGGCAGGNYCPGNPVTRAQMAVFLLKAKEGAAYVPPACAGIFDDVTCTPGSGFGDWIEQLAARGITGGCGVNLYCPNNTVTRKQMAPFLLKTLYDSTHVPPVCQGAFTDVPCAPGVGFDDFIEELYGLGITGGCATGPLRYCPDNPNTRAQMAVFLVKTFNLVW